MAENEIADLVKLIEFEIRHLRSQEKRPGWNTWALLCTLGATLWLGLAEVEKHPVSINKVLFAFLVFSLSYYSITFLVNFFIPSQIKKGPLRFYITKMHFPYSRLPVFINILLYATLSLIVFFNPLLGQTSIKYWALAYCLFFLLAFFFFLILTLFEFPILTGQTSAYVIADVLLIFFSAAITFKLNMIFWSLQPTLPEVRVGVLAVVATTCITLLSTSTPQSPLLSTLTDVRRKLGLNQISYSDAKKQTEIALEGLQISDILQTQVDIILSNLRKVIAVEKSILQEFRSLSSTIPDFNNLSPEQRILRDSVIRSARSRLETILNLRDVNKQALKRLKKKLIFMGATKQARSEVGHFLDRLEAQVDEVKQISAIQTKEISKEISEMMDMLEPEKVSNGTQKPALLTNNT